MYFAISPLNVDSFTADLVRSWQQAGTELLGYALVDAAFDQRVVKRYAANAVSVYRNTELAGLEELSPRLISLPRVPDRSVEEIKSLCTKCRQAPMLSFIASPCSPDELSTHLRYLFTTETEDRLKWPIRFADTRILPQLLKTLSIEQAARIGLAIHNWWWPDRTGKLTSCSPPFGRACDRPRISLAQTQFDELVDAAAPDALLAQLEMVAPELLDRHAGHDTHSLAAEAFSLAQQQGHSGSPAQLHLISAALILSHGFQKIPEFKAALAASRNDHELIEQLTAIDDSVWNGDISIDK